MRSTAFFILMMLLLPITAAAQWKSSISLGSSFYKGNVDKFNLHTSGSVSHADSLFEYSSSAQATYSETDGQTDNQVLQGGLKFDYLPYGTWSPFTAVSAYNNKPKKIDLRLSALAGIKYTFINTVNKEGVKIADYSISAAIQVDKEQYTTDADDTEKVRLSVRPKFEHNLNEHVRIKHVTYFVPKINEFADYNMDSETSLKSSLTDKLSLELKYKLSHQSVLPDKSLENTDHAVIASLALSI